MALDTDPTLEPKFDEHGLIPAILQDAQSGQVLMLAWMNAQALQQTQQTGQAHFWSRSRQELWHKGATSGNFQPVEEIRIDCDGDALLLRVHPAGPACHTGEPSCFYRTLSGQEPGEKNQGFSLDALFRTILSRRTDPTPGSYTASLFAKGEDEIVKKVGEEAVEVILAAKGQGDQRLIEEIADLTYHVLVLLAQHNLSPDDIQAELARRHR